MRTVTEQKIFTREQIEAALKSFAKAEIVGGMYIGEFQDQKVIWNTDGTVTVLTRHTPGNWDDFKGVAR